MCPACKHNNTDVSIHQADPGEANERRPGNPLKLWADGSVWSVVCALELGLLSEASLKGISFGTAADGLSVAKIGGLERRKGTRACKRKDGKENPGRNENLQAGKRSAGIRAGKRKKGKGRKGAKPKRKLPGRKAKETQCAKCKREAASRLEEAQRADRKLDGTRSYKETVGTVRKRGPTNNSDRDRRKGRNCEATKISSEAQRSSLGNREGNRHDDWLERKTRVTKSVDDQDYLESKSAEDNRYRLLDPVEESNFSSIFETLTITEDQSKEEESRASKRKMPSPGGSDSRISKVPRKESCGVSKRPFNDATYAESSLSGKNGEERKYENDCFWKSRGVTDLPAFRNPLSIYSIRAFDRRGSFSENSSGSPSLSDREDVLRQVDVDRDDVIEDCPSETSFDRNRNERSKPSRCNEIALSLTDAKSAPRSIAETFEKGTTETSANSIDENERDRRANLRRNRGTEEKRGKCGGKKSAETSAAKKSERRRIRDARRNDVESERSKNSRGRGTNCREDAKISIRDEKFLEARRVTRGLTKINKENFVGKLVWGSCSGWWPALIIDAEHVGMLSEPGKLWVYWIGEARISLLNERTQIEPFACNLEYRFTRNRNAPRTRAIDATVQMLRKRFSCNLTKPYHVWIEKTFSGPYGSLDDARFHPYPANIQRRLDQLKERNTKTTEKYLLEQKLESSNEPRKSVERPRESADADVTRLRLGEQNPGTITWAKILGHNWWPAMIIDYRDCCMREPSFGCQWIMWYGDYQLSEVHHQLFLKFDKGIEKMREYINRTKKHIYLVGVLQAAKDYCSRFGFESENWRLEDALDHFAKFDGLDRSTLPTWPRDSAKVYDKYSAHIVEKLNELKNSQKLDDERQEDIKNSDDLHSVRSGKEDVQKLCLKCLKITERRMEKHPFFEGSLCKECSEELKPCMFVFGNDGKCFYCTVCASSGMVVICDKEDCPRVYCTACLKHLLCPKTYEDVLLEDPWECFLCKPVSDHSPDMLVKARTNWKERMIDIFRTTDSSNSKIVRDFAGKRKIRVLSLFDGLSTGLLVLLKLGLTVDVYYASEIDTDALMVSNSHFGDRIVHLGNVKDITKEKIEEMAPIDLLIGGSPCNDLSLANPARLGLHDPRGTGVLFFEYCRIMKLLKKANREQHLFWLYENVASMPSEYRLEMNKHLGQEPDVIDSADFSPQHRLRLYWHNLPIETRSLTFQAEQDVQDILTPNCQRYALVKKIRTVTTKVNSLKQGKLALKPILMKNESDSLWITELEEIFGFPRHYTDVKNLSATKRQRLIGKSWSVQTLSAIFRPLCAFFECEVKRAT